MLLEYLRAQLLLNFGYELSDLPLEIYGQSYSPTDQSLSDAHGASEQHGAALPEANQEATAPDASAADVDFQQLNKQELEYLLEQFQPDRHAAPITQQELAA